MTASASNGEAANSAGRFTADDFKAVGELVIAAWQRGIDLDWSVPAGTLEWSCLQTADHTIDCVFSYALFLGSRKQDGYPKFGELHALDDAGPADMIDGLRATCAMLWSVIVTAEPDARAVIWLRPSVATGTPQDFAARGAHELILHAHDVCSGLQIDFDPPREFTDRLWTSVADRPGVQAAPSTGDSWHDLLIRSGRPATEPSGAG